MTASLRSVGRCLWRWVWTAGKTAESGGATDGFPANADGAAGTPTIEEAGIPTLSAMWQVLLHHASDTIAFGLVGYGAAAPQEVVAFHALRSYGSELNEIQHELEATAAHRSPAARLYAALLVGEIDARRGASLLERMRGDIARCRLVHGCDVVEQSLGEVATGLLTHPQDLRLHSENTVVGHVLRVLHPILRGPPRLVVSVEQVEEFPDYWLFPISSQAYAESGGANDQIPGISPIIVDKRTVRLFQSHAFLPPEAFQQSYQSTGRPPDNAQAPERHRPGRSRSGSALDSGSS